MADPAKKQSLILELREARGQLASNISGLKQDLSIGKRFRRSVRERPFVWYAGAAVLGLILAKIPPMGKKVVVPQPIFAKQQKAGKAAVVLGAIKIFLDLGRPFITNWLKERAKNGPMPRPVQRARSILAGRAR
jgi:hypothetical protein